MGRETFSLPGFLPHFKCSAFGLFCFRGAVSRDTDIFGLTETICVVYTIYRLTFYIQMRVGRFGGIFKRIPGFLFEASAAGAIGSFCILAFHFDFFFTAQQICVMQTGGYTTA